MPAMLRPGLLLTLALTACSTVDTSADTDTLATGSQSGSADTGAQGTSNDPSSNSPTTGPGGTGNLDVGETTSADETTGAGAGIDYSGPGAHPVGNTRFTLPSGERDLLVEVWYPADPSAARDAAAGHPIEDFVPAGPDHDTLVDLLADLSPSGQIGTRLQTSSAFDAPPVAGPWPLIVFSHCHNCVRFSAFTVAERLASHGFVVAAPDHVGNTLFDSLGGMDTQIGEEFLQVRVADLQAVLDVMLASVDPVPAALHGLVDPDRIGALGHSFGAATTGRIAQDDPRIKAALPIAAPVENPLFPGTHVADIHVPMLSILAREDNSIQQIGNNLIEMNFNNANPPVRLVSVADAGHWGFTDICGLVAGFDPGCGEGTRQTEPGVPFTYLDVAVSREIAGAYSLAFFDRYLRDNVDAEQFLGAATPADVVTVESRL